MRQLTISFGTRVYNEVTKREKKDVRSGSQYLIIQAALQSVCAGLPCAKASVWFP